MRILLVHNRYQHTGGEDGVVTSEADLLRKGGHEVRLLMASNDDIRSSVDQAVVAAQVIYNFAGRHLVSDEISTFGPDIVHVHNFFPRLSPAVFDACRKANVPSVWTLHNFRALCANGFLFRDGQPCEACVGRIPVAAIRHGCYRGSRVGSTAVAAMIAYHQHIGTWRRKVSRFIALTEFAKQKFIAGGIPSDRLFVKPNFSEDLMPDRSDLATRRNGAVFVGRLSPEKGVKMLIDAWHKIDAPLTIIGDGPERTALEAMAPANVRFLGFLDRPAVRSAMANAQVLVVPSIWYEMFGLVAIEAMALGTPVVAFDIGALSEIVLDHVNGRLVQPGRVDELIKVLHEFFAATDRHVSLSAGARHTYVKRYSPTSNLEMLEEIYNGALLDIKH